MHEMFNSEVTEFPVKRGKVRDVYDIGDKLVIVTTDRLSAFDWVMPNPIPHKGVILTQVTQFWLNLLEKHGITQHHGLSTDLKDMPEPFQRPEYEGRTMLVRKLEPYPVECIVRSHLSGSGWKEYQKNGTAGGIVLPKGLKENMALVKPMFTPSTKAETGHDENITFDQMVTLIGNRMQFGEPGYEDTTNLGLPRIYSNAIASYSKTIFQFAYEYAWNRGIIIADTKFEFGRDGRRGYQTILIDEVLTPDSCRYWPMDGYCLDRSPPSLDKQYVRDYLSGCGWDKNSPPPELPRKVVAGTSQRYIELYERLLERKFNG